MEKGAVGPAPPADARATISCGGCMVASPRRKSSSSSSNSSHRPISGFRGGRTGTLTGADWWYGGAAGPAFFGLAVAGMARAAEFGDWVGDIAPPLPAPAPVPVAAAAEAEAEAAAAAMVALRRSSVPALAAAAAAAVPPPPAPPRTRRRLSPSCIASAARRPRCPCACGAPRPGLLGGGGAASGDEKRKSSSWSSSPATNEGSVGDDEGVDGDENIPMKRSPAGDRRVRYSSIARSGPPGCPLLSWPRLERAMRRRGGLVFMGVCAARDPPGWGRGETRAAGPHARSLRSVPRLGGTRPGGGAGRGCYGGTSGEGRRLGAGGWICQVFAH
uniref:Uncharacterized protein n=1 Tax=Setaria italica TaxID=4555 RepID=K3Y8N5_SETIT